MMYKRKAVFLCFISMFLFTSCEDLSKMSGQIDKMKDTQNQMLSQQDKILKTLAALDKKVSSANKPANNKPSKNNNKRKTPDPNFVHNIDIGNSVVLGNPDAKITVTKFTDFQ